MNNSLRLLVLIIVILATSLAAKASFSPIATNPAHNDDDLIARNPIFTLDFAHNVCWYMYIISIKKASDDSTVDNLNLGNMSGEGSPTITFTSNVTLNSNTAYYLDVAPASLYDCVPDYSNSNIAIRVDFTTGSCTGSGTCCYNPPQCIGPCIAEDPEILHKSPPDGGRFMQAYEGINMILDQAVTVGVGNITIRKYSDDSAVETIDVTSNKVTGWGTTSITINPSVNLADNTHYYINLDLTDYATVADKDKWDFWTKSTPNTFSGTGL